MPGVLYFDNASTSFPKAPGVGEAMARFVEEIGASPGRGAYRAAHEAAGIIGQCRRRLAEFLGGEGPERFCFTLNTTDALNIAIKGAVRAAGMRRPGGAVHIIAGGLEHNAVTRPLAVLASAGVEVSYLPVGRDTGVIDVAELRGLLRPSTALVVLNMAGNVSGALQPVAQAAEVCRAAGVAIVVDAAQAAGHVPMNLARLGADAFALAGHKGLLGPQGVGVLYVRPGSEERFATVREGGTGGQSASDEHPVEMPQRFEAGTPNVPGIAGLNAALAYVLSRGEDLFDHQRRLVEAMLAGCEAAGIDAVAHAGDAPRGAISLLGPGEAGARVGVFSFLTPGARPAEVAMLMEQQRGVCARSGLTCAPAAHASLGTLEPRAEGAAAVDPGVVRLSVGAMLTAEDVATALAALVEAAALLRS
jgi:cysteine desulfurase/selenocysteine lyase